MSIESEDCTHEQTEIRRRVDSIGRSFFKRQCLTCGIAIGDAIRRERIQGDVPDWDKLLEEEQAAARQGTHAVTAQANRVQWWENYNAYLRSEKWAGKRERVLMRDNQKCQACLRAEANEVHHLTYRHVFDEPLFELVSVCTPCHRKLTEMDRKLFDPFEVPT